MSLVAQLQSLATRIATETKGIKTMVNGNAADLSALTTTTKTSLVAAINEVKASVGAGVPTVLDDLSDVVIATPATGHVLRHNGTNWVNALGTTFFEVAGAAASAQSAAIAASQPLDSDLTAIAALTTTTYGRSLLTLANQAALTAANAAGTTTTAGILPLATDLQSTTGTNTTNATTPSNIAAVFSNRIDTDGTLAGNSATKVASQSAVKTYVDGILDANNAFQYKGVQDCSANPNYPAASAGWTYKVSVAGKVGGASGKVVEVGDSLVCLVDSSASGNDATVGANWMILQTNIDGAVVGPASSTASNFATFSGTTGKVVQDSGLALDTDGTLTANSDTKIASQKAVKTYTGAYAQPLATNLTALGGTTSAANKVPYFSGAGTATTTDLTAAGRTLIGGADATAQRTSLAVFSTTEVGDVTTDFVATFTAGL